MDNNGLNHYKYFESFRVKTHKKDNLDLTLSLDNFETPIRGQHKLYDINLIGLSIVSDFPFKEQQEVNIKLSKKKLFGSWDLKVKGTIISTHLFDDEDPTASFAPKRRYIISLKENLELHYFLKEHISSFSNKFLKSFLTQSIVKEKNINSNEAYEIFHLASKLYEQTTLYALNDTQNLQKKILESSCELIQCENIKIYYLDKDNKLSNTVSTKDINQKSFPSRQGIIGECFSTGLLINTVKFDDTSLPKHTKSILCAPLKDRENKIIGVLAFLNKRNHDFFSYQDECHIQFLSHVLSSFAKGQFSIKNDNDHEDLQYYAPDLERTQELIRLEERYSFSPGNITLYGEDGTGKSFIAKRFHYRKLGNEFEIMEISFSKLSEYDRKNLLNNKLSPYNLNNPGTLILHEVSLLSKKEQLELYNILLHSKKRIIHITKTHPFEQVKQHLIITKLHELLSSHTAYVACLDDYKHEIEELARIILKNEATRRNIHSLKLSSSFLLKLHNMHFENNIKGLRDIIKKAIINSDESIIDFSLYHQELKKVS